MKNVFSRQASKRPKQGEAPEEEEQQRILRADLAPPPPLGEYTLHLYLIDTCKIICESDLNALMEVECMGQRKQTRIWRGIGQSSKTRWDEHLFFRKSYSNREELEQESLTITLYNHSKLLINERLGTIKRYIFNLVDRVQVPLLNQWCIFADPVKDFGTAKGFLRFSMSFAPSTEEQKDLETMSLEAADEGKLDLPPQISITSREILVHIYRGRNILGIEKSGLSDPFVEVNVAGESLRTKTVKQEANPTIYQTIRLRYMEPTINDRILVRLWDYNLIQSNVQLGSVSLPLQDIKDGLFSVPKWVHFYGASAHSINHKVKEIMINEPDFASTFVGELFMSVTSAENPKAGLAVDNMTEKQVAQEKVGKGISVTFVLQFDVEYVYNLDIDPAQASTMEVTLEWGSTSGSNRVAGQKFQNKLLIVNNGFTLQRTFDVCFSSRDERKMNREVYRQIPSVFVYLTVNGKNVSFYRFNPIEILMNVNGFKEGQTIKMTPDMSVSDLSIDGAGLMKVRVGLREEPRGPAFLAYYKALYQNQGNVQQALDTLAALNLPKDPADPIPVSTATTLFPKPDPQMRYQNIYIFVQVFQAKDLLNVEEDGLPDTFVDLYHFGSNVRTRVIKNHLNPSWQEMLCLKSYRVNKEVPNLVVNLLDSVRGNLSGDRNELIGWTEVPLTMAEYTENESDLDYPDPKWLNLKVVGEVSAGQVLMSVKWCLQSTIRNRTDLVSAKSTDLRYSTSTYHTKITIMALRDLKPHSQLLPTNSEVIIDPSMLQREGTDSTRRAQQIRMTADGVGVNPMYRQTQYTTLALPEELYLIPSISGQVNNRAFSLFSNSQIGNFTFDLSVFAYISKVKLIAGLEAVREKRETLARQNPDDRTHREVLGAISGVINHLSVDLKRQGKYIEDKMPEVFVQVNVLRDDTKELVAQRLDVQDMNTMMPLLRGFSSKTPSGGPTFQKTPEPEMTDTDGGLQVGSDRIGIEMETHGVDIKPINKEEKPSLQLMGLRGLARMEKPLGASLPSNAGNANTKFDITETLLGLPQRPGPINVFQPGLFELYEKSQKRGDLVVIRYEDWERLKLPPEERKKYMELGYRNSTVNTLHYRLRVDDNLEDTGFMGVDPFASLPIYRGRVFLKSGKGFFDFLESKVAEPRVQTGTVRAKVELIQQEVFAELSQLPLTEQERKAIDVPVSVDEWRKGRSHDHHRNSGQVVIYLYVLSAEFSVNMDTLGKNDSYIKVVLENKTIKGKRVIQDSDQPRFMERFDIPCSLHDSSLLEIQFWDEDVLADDFIGATKIELMRRFFDRRCRGRKDNPIEIRTLTNRNGSQTGFVTMWVDICTKGPDGRLYTLDHQPASPYDIEPRPPTRLYLRGVVWDTLNMPITDLAGAADYVVVISIPALNTTQKTDVHLRSTDGDAFFNWRFEFMLLIDFNFEYSNARVDFRVFDKDIFTPDKSLAHLEIDFADMLRIALLTDQDQTMRGPMLEDEKALSDRFMKPMEVTHGLKGVDKGRSKIELSLEVLTQKGKENKPAGLGRSTPNDFPFLPPPENRMQWSWNPVKMFNQIFGRNCRRYCLLIIIAIILILLLGFFGPILVSMIISRVIVG